jgi:REP element-mobilizing transposase RayT
MPAYARRQIVDESQVGAYHCVSRCVRRAFLCGDDRFTGKNFDHRKVWMQERMEMLAGIMAVDVLGFSVMSNHIHLLLRIRPDVAASWSDEEVARRWWRLHPGRRDDDGTPAEPEPAEIALLLADAEALPERRRRLSSLSSFMGALCEPIARRANKEDHATGRFWEGRFKSQAVLDEAALLACSIYIDLNPIRAGLAETPETSQFTAAYERIAARQNEALRLAGACQEVTVGRTAVETEVSWQAACSATSVPARTGNGAVDERRADDWFSPIPNSEARACAGSAPSIHRASEQGFLPLGVDDYLALLDWTGRQTRAGKIGSVPAELRPILERLQINADRWVESVVNLGRRFHRAIGRASSMAARAASSGKHWLQGMSASRLVFT